MAARSRPLEKLAVIFGTAVLMAILATLAFAAHRHPECASVPGDVGPCGYWARVAEYGPFIMLWATISIAGAAVWPVVVGALGLGTALRSRLGNRRG